MKYRFLLVSDMHYTTQETYAELKQKYPEANASVAAGTILGVTQTEKIQKIISDINAEYQKQPFDAVLVLGDLSIDDWDMRNLPDIYCRKFKEDCMDKLPCPAYALPGNHDSIPNEMWKSIFGYNREYSVKIGNNVFLMLDTFKKIPATAACGGRYSGIDREFLQNELSKYTDNENIFICTHYVGEKYESELPEIPNLKCLFRGHTHAAKKTSFYGTPLYDIGGYGYNGINIEGRGYTFNIFFPECAWGYNMLEVEDDKFNVWHKTVKMTYLAENGTFEIEEEIKI